MRLNLRIKLKGINSSPHNRARSEERDLCSRGGTASTSQRSKIGKTRDGGNL